MLSGLTFGSPFWLWALLALPALALVFAWSERRAVVRLARLIQAPRLRAQLTGAASAARRRARYVLLLGALGALLLALAAPRYGYETRETHRRGLDLLFVVDVSKSMLATDLPPSRLARARLAVQDFVARLPGDRVGLVAFAGTAFLQAPLTVDYDAVLNSVNELDAEIIPRGGTNLGAALDLATDAFGKADAGNRAVVLLSDGEPTVEGEAAAGVRAAQRAAEAGVRVYTMGLGTPEGSLIPLGSSGSFVRDADGKIVRTKLDEGTLQAVAKAGGGFYTRFNGDGAIRTVLQQGLGQLKAGEIDARTTKRPIERYQWPLGAGLILLGVGAFLGERRRTAAPLSARARAEAERRAPVSGGVAVGTILLSLTLVPVGRAESRNAASKDALELYRQGKYDQAYKAFEDLARNDPRQASLGFNAGASAYKGKQYDEALDAFGKAMTSNDPGLQAKANYNFGNTLFRRGADKKERDAKAADWKSALEHYDATLGSLKARGSKADPRLNADAAFNRDYVQKQLDELLKQPPPQQDKKSDQNKDKQQKNEDQPKDPQNQEQQSKSDGSQPPQPSPADQNKGKPENAGKEQPDGKNQQNPQAGNQAPSPSPGQSDQQQGGKEGDKKEDKGGGTPQAAPPDPNAGKPRERGDFQAKEGQPSPTPVNDPGQAEEKEEAGKMNAAQARALLDSLKGEDAHVTLGGDQKRNRADDEPPVKDW